MMISIFHTLLRKTLVLLAMSAIQTDKNQQTEKKINSFVAAAPAIIWSYTHPLTDTLTHIGRNTYTDRNTYMH